MDDNKKVVEKRIKREQGFTLIEVLMGVVVLSIGILSLISMELCAGKSNSLAKKMTEGAVAVEREVEALMSATFTEDSVSSDLAGGAHSKGVGCWTIDWTVTDGYVGSVVAYKTVRLTARGQELEKQMGFSSVFVVTRN